LVVLANFYQKISAFRENIFFFTLLVNLTLNNTMPIKIGEIWTSTLDFLGQAWWVEISTTEPKCTYYFGPFVDAKEADKAVSGYIEDLESESARGIQVQIKRCKPERLTIDHDMGESSDRERVTMLSGRTSVS
jgi:hypothetical protein